jgi:hypothetical protein
LGLRAIGKFFEGRASVSESNGVTRCRLIAPDDDIDIERIELDPAAHPPGTLGGEQSGPGAEEGIENNFTTVRQIDHRILQHCGRFHRWMILKTFPSI